MVQNSQEPSRTVENSQEPSRIIRKNSQDKSREAKNSQQRRGKPRTTKNRSKSSKMVKKWEKQSRTIWSIPNTYESYFFEWSWLFLFVLDGFVLVWFRIAFCCFEMVKFRHVNRQNTVFACPPLKPSENLQNPLKNLENRSKSTVLKVGQSRAKSGKVGQPWVNPCFSFKKILFFQNRENGI